MVIAALLFASAIAALFGAHFLRSHRHSLLFADGCIRSRFDLLLGLSVSYLVNLLVPLRLGEVLRIAVIAARYRLRPGYVAMTVVAERLSDLAILAVVAMLLGSGRTLQAQTCIVAALSVALAIGFAVAVHRSHRARRLLWLLSAPLNERIRLALADFAWNLAELLVRREMLRPRYLLATAAMWAMYFVAYALFAAALGVPVGRVLAVLFDAPLQPLLGQALQAGGEALAVPLIGFAGAPLLAVVGYGVSAHTPQIVRMVQLLRRAGLGPLGMAQPLTGQRFRDKDSYDNFLRATFAGDNSRWAQFGAFGLAGGTVHKMLPGGSDALTAVVEIDGRLAIRKCASGPAGAKLRRQREWLERSGADLPLAELLDERQHDGVYSFDMRFRLSARDFYDVIHTQPLPRSQQVLLQVADRLHAFHRRHATGIAAQATVDAYLQSKAIDNARQIVDFARLLLDGDSFRLNGEDYALSEWDCLLDIDWLRAQVVRRETARIHGDLTVENIIVCPELDAGWYIIDPNPENVFDTPLIDWAKTMQSLNLGYEALLRGQQSRLVGRDIHLALARSTAYAQLHRVLQAEIVQRLGEDALREIAFHELINYLRLTPYKIRNTPEKAMTFFACTALLLRRYREGVAMAPSAHGAADGQYHDIA